MAGDSSIAQHAVRYIGRCWAKSGRPEFIFLFCMGNKQSKSYKPPTFSRQNWHPAGAARCKTAGEQGSSVVFRNNLTDEEVEEYQLSFRSQAEFQKYLEFFEWREREDCIVNTKFLNHEQNKEFCNSNHSARVFIEHVPVRLSDIQDIPYPQNLYVLFSALDGFEKLYQAVGYFRISEDLICMDREGRVKVWLNPDLSKCHSLGSSTDDASSLRQSERLEEQMVSEIVTVVEANTTQEIEASMSFSDFLRHSYKGRGIGYRQAKQELIKYAQKYQTDIPNFFESVIGIFDQPTDPSHPEQHQDSNDYEQQLKQAEEQHVFEHYSYHPRQRKESAARGEEVRTLQRVPSSEIYGIDSYMRPATHMPTLTYLLAHQRPQSPIHQLPQPPQVARINNTSLNVKFNYQPTLASQPQPLASQPHPTLASQPHPTSALPPPPLRNPFQPAQQPPPAIQPQSDDLLKRTSSLRGLILNSKLVYSDSTQTYELDPEIAEDMFKYLSP